MSGLSMYEQAMGADYARLHPTVQRFHRLAGEQQLQGEVRCAPAAHWLGRLLAWTMRAPRHAVQGPLRFELRAASRQEHWVRHFPGCTMQSTLRLRGAEVVEQLGPATLHFGLGEQDGRLVMRLKRMRFAGVPCPRWLMPRITAQERADEAQRFCFEVEARVPGLGTVVSYQGHLLVPQEQVPA